MRYLEDISEFIISKGIPVFNGITEGEAVVVKSSIDFQKVENSQEKIILIVNNFDPNYDILLNKCKGIASELGNILCHLAIVARIRKIPALVNAKNITSLIKDGEKLTIDAYNGILYRGMHLDRVKSENQYNFIDNFYLNLGNKES